LLSAKRKSSGAVHRIEQRGPCAEVSVQLKLAMDDRPKSVRQAQPELLTRMLALLKWERVRISIFLGLGALQTYSFEVTMNYAMGVKNLEPMTDVEELI
jgi:hypothetical protein